MARPRIATGVLWQETNAFNPIPTRIDDFVIRRDHDALTREVRSNTALSGILTTMSAEVDLHCILAARARPGGVIDAATMRHLEESLLAGIVDARPDAVCLELHGAMVSEDCADPEGRFLTRLRAGLGSDIPIVAALDLHGHMTPEMFHAADLITAYRTQPHVDMFETGVRAAGHTLRFLATDRRPAAIMQSLPLIALTNDATTEGPMHDIHALLARAGDGLFDWSLFNTHPFLDNAGMGQVAVAYADTVPPAEAFAKAALEGLWVRRESFTMLKPGLEALPDLVRRARLARRLLVLGDEGDSVLAGTPGNSTALAWELADLNVRALVPIWSPDTVKRAMLAGPGSVIDATIGGTATTTAPPLTGRFEVLRLTNGIMTNEGHYMRGVEADLGPCAALRHGPLTILATTAAPSVVDPCLIRHAMPTGEVPEALVVKSSNHYQLSFGQDVMTQTLATPGLSARNAKDLPHVHARQVFPINPNATLAITTHTRKAKG